MQELSGNRVAEYEIRNHATPKRLFGIIVRVAIGVALPMLLAGCFICPSPLPPDAFEPNDTLETASALELGVPLQGSLNRGDTDVFAFDAEAGDVLTVTLKTLKYATSYSSRGLHLLGPDGFEILVPPDGPYTPPEGTPTWPSEIEVPTSGRYYLLLWEALWASDVDYHCVFPVRGSAYKLTVERVP